LLLLEVTAENVWDALQNSRAYVAFDWLADPTGFVYQAVQGDMQWPLGSDLPMSEGLQLQAETPLAAHFKVIRDGDVVHEADGVGIELPIDQAGVYRVEAWLTMAGEPRPWILTNPIYVHTAK
jgi:hypothetical protein